MDTLRKCIRPEEKVMALDEVGDWTLWPWVGGGGMQVFLFLVGNSSLRMTRNACLASTKKCYIYEWPKHTANVDVISVKISSFLVDIALKTALSISKRDKLSTLHRTTVAATGVLV